MHKTVTGSVHISARNVVAVTNSSRVNMRQEQRQLYFLQVESKSSFQLVPKTRPQNKAKCCKLRCGVREYKCDNRRNTRKGEPAALSRNRRSLNFRFRSTPPIFGHRPQYGSEAAGQWAEERSKCYYQNCHHSRRVGEKWIGLLSEGGRWGVGCGVSLVGKFWKKEILGFDPQSPHAMHPLNDFYIDGCFSKSQFMYL